MGVVDGLNLTFGLMGLVGGVILTFGLMGVVGGVILTFLARSSDLQAMITLAPIMAIHLAVSYPIPVTLIEVQVD